MSTQPDASRPNNLHGQRLGRALIDAGIITLEERVRRVIIDAPANGPVIVHVERLGDERLLEIVDLLKDVEIRRAEPEAGS